MKNKAIRYIGFALVIVAAVLVGLALNWRVVPAPGTAGTAPAGQNAAATASLMIDYGNGTVATYHDLPVTSTTTLFALLQAACKNNNVPLSYKDYGGSMGIFIQAINGVGTGSTSKWWQYWVNNNYGQIGVSNYDVKPGDVIEFKFTSGQSNG